jgi:hypothetical protein
MLNSNTENDADGRQYGPSSAGKENAQLKFILGLRNSAHRDAKGSHAQRGIPPHSYKRQAWRRQWGQRERQRERLNQMEKEEGGSAGMEASAVMQNGEARIDGKLKGTTANVGGKKQHNSNGDINSLIHNENLHRADKRWFRPVDAVVRVSVTDPDSGWQVHARKVDFELDVLASSTLSESELATAINQYYKT